MTSPIGHREARLTDGVDPCSGFLAVRTRALGTPTSLKVLRRRAGSEVSDVFLCPFERPLRAREHVATFRMESYESVHPYSLSRTNVAPLSLPVG